MPYRHTKEGLCRCKHTGHACLSQIKRDIFGLLMKTRLFVTILLICLCNGTGKVLNTTANAGRLASRPLLIFAEESFHSVHLDLCDSLLFPQVTDAQLQVSAVPGSRYQFRPSLGAGAASAGGPTSSSSMLRTPPGATPGAAPATVSSLAAGMGGYTSAAAAGARFGGGGGGSAGGFMPTTGKLLGKSAGGVGPHTTMSFSPKSVTPRAGQKEGLATAGYGSAISAGGLT